MAIRPNFGTAAAKKREWKKISNRKSKGIFKSEKVKRLEGISSMLKEKAFFGNTIFEVEKEE